MLYEPRTQNALTAIWLGAPSSVSPETSSAIKVVEAVGEACRPSSVPFVGRRDAVFVAVVAEKRSFEKT